MQRLARRILRSTHILKTMAPKKVAIIGAGPGGLVTAKTLLRSHSRDTFQVTIFEKSDRIGGIWSVTEDKPDGIIPIEMPTNLSQFAVSFSDLAWSGLDLPGGPAYTHPKAWQVNRYLEEYARRYIPSESIKLGTEITSIERHESGGWRLSGNSFKESFDFCVLASGFYGGSLSIRCKIEGFRPENAPVKLVHSSQYRSLQDILPDKPKRGKNLLVIGGANSGGEAAAALAFDLSHSQYAPGGQDHDYQIIHVTPKPIYGIPLIVPSADIPGTYVPLDVRFYDLSKRPDQPLSLNIGLDNQDKRKFLHGLLQGMLGTDPYENGHYKPVNQYQGDLPPMKAAIQDNWASYVRSGAIKTQIGRVTSLHSQGPDKPLSATISSAEGIQPTINDIAGIIYATGYTPESSLQLLSPKIKDILHHDPLTPRLPLLLPNDALSSHPSLPNLGFVGLYEGPYWGVLEMQARHLAARWSSPSPTIPTEESSKLTQTRLDALLEIRRNLKDNPNLVPQYIFSDYTAIMEESAHALDLVRNDGSWNSDKGPITPARYLDSGSDREQSELTISSLQTLLSDSAEKGRFIPSIIFRGLLGRWTLNRNLESAKPDFPSGTFEGEAWFHPRRPSPTPDKVQADKEYLYLETGQLTTTTGLSFPAYKSYIYTLSSRPPSEKMSVWFTKLDNRTLDYLYHDLSFDVDKGPVVKGNGFVQWTAKADHLCVKDFYETRYEFTLDGVALRDMRVEHRVKGPGKDYVSSSRYRRE